ncbi:hypothetical protein [Cerasicoccus frondis]|uniref:hypothetical protein n=1 Tax=Cerasicoccus frondis TaxID=490090 RepID=UPI0028525D7E|nr:hypothetical protein [Cerasicoccus frondis]
MIDKSYEFIDAVNQIAHGVQDGVYQKQFKRTQPLQCTHFEYEAKERMLETVRFQENKMRNRLQYFSIEYSLAANSK